eukprot:scaffold5296_cov163-Amphora_coffeaeformis.AAC.2
MRRRNGLSSLVGVVVSASLHLLARLVVRSSCPFVLLVVTRLLSFRPVWAAGFAANRRMTIQSCQYPAFWVNPCGSRQGRGCSDPTDP